MHEGADYLGTREINVRETVRKEVRHRDPRLSRAVRR